MTGNQSRGLGAALKIAIALLAPLKKEAETTTKTEEKKSSSEALSSSADGNTESKKGSYGIYRVESQ